MDAKNEFSLKRIEPTSFVFSKDKLLGKGAFGQVYWGFDEKQKIPVAIKTISFSKLSQVYTNHQDAIGKKVAGELINMQVCKGQRLVRLISPHHSSKNMYVVCQYCNGGSLKQYLSKKGQLSQYQTLNFFKDILEGFKELNESKIVHRDMKPANLLLNNRRIKIGDLGFSKIISVHQQILTSAVGTPLYMSPQILSSGKYTQKTDIWSLGIILYQMLVGEAPWRVTSLQQIKQKVKHKPEIPRNCYISNDTKSLILKLLTSQQKQRIGWQELFNIYLHPQWEMQEQLTGLAQKVKQIDSYFLYSLAIQSQYHIISILEKNNIKYVEFYQGCESSAEFFQRIKQSGHQQKIIQPIVNMYIENRNKNAFLMKLFVQCYENCSELASPLVLASMLMIVKYCISMTEAMLSNFAEGMDNLQMFLHSCYYKNLMQLLTLDLEKMNSLLKIFQSQLFIPGLKQLSATQPDGVHTVEKDLKLFFGEQSAGIKFTEFWMKNQCRQLFNAFKQLQVLPNKWMLIPRMIYQYEKSTKTHLFANMGQKSNMNKKLEVWAQEERWKNKIKEVKKFEIESLVSFINREVAWNSLNMLGMSFGKNQFE